MTDKQEIRAKALELAIQWLALLPEQKRMESTAKLMMSGVSPSQQILEVAKPFEALILQAGE